MSVPCIGKSSIPILIGMAAMFFILIVWSLSFRSRQPVNPAALAHSPSDAVQQTVKAPGEELAFQSLAELLPAVSPLESNSPEELGSRLAWFKRWRDGLNEVDDLDFRIHFRLAQEELRGVRELILSDPRTFLDWLSDPSNSTCAKDLVGITLTDKSGPYLWKYASQSFDQFPTSLMEGTLQLLQTGVEDVRLALLEFSQTLTDPPHSWRTQFHAMLQDPNPWVADQAAKSLMANRQATLSEVRAIIDLADRSQRNACLSLANAVNRDPKWRDWLLHSLETGAMGDTYGLKTRSALEISLSSDSSPAVEERSRGSRTLQATLGRLTDSKSYFDLLRIALGLQLDANQIRDALTLASASAPTESLRRAATESLSHPDLNSDDLGLRRSIWMKAYEKYHPPPRDWE